MKTKEMKKYANITLLRTLKYFKNAVSEKDYKMSYFYEHYFEAQWNILFHIGLKNNTYPYKWFTNYENKYLYK